MPCPDCPHMVYVTDDAWENSEYTASPVKIDRAGRHVLRVVSPGRSKDFTLELEAPSYASFGEAHRA